MVEDADGTDDLASNLRLSETCNVCGIANDEGSASGFFTASDTDGLTVFDKNFVNVGV